MAAAQDNPLPPVRGRLAPSPTGYLHLGNIWTFLLCWLAVRSRAGRLVLRLEDIDADRSRPEFARAIQRDLTWLGLNWDEGPGLAGPYGPYTQSMRLERYAEVIARLETLGRVYPCYCTRKELKSMASAPHDSDVGPVYPGTCAHLKPAECRAREALGRKPALRLRGGETTTFTDLVHGPVRLSWMESGGDFPLRRSDGVLSYQLAVAVDDLDQHISLVVRGQDILPSTPHQLALVALLGGTAPQYAHVPLVTNHAGERLAKRHASMEIRALRDMGVRPEAIIGYLGHRAGLLPHRTAVAPQELLPAFAWSALPLSPVRLEPDVDNILARMS